MGKVGKQDGKNLMIDTKQSIMIPAHIGNAVLPLSYNTCEGHPEKTSLFFDHPLNETTFTLYLVTELSLCFLSGICYLLEYRGLRINFPNSIFRKHWLPN